MKITIDTKEDSASDIRKVIALLSKFIEGHEHHSNIFEDDSSFGSEQNSGAVSSPDSGSGGSGGLFGNLFGNSLAGNSAGSKPSGIPSVKLGSDSAEKTNESEEIPEIIVY